MNETEFYIIANSSLILIYRDLETHDVFESPDRLIA